MITWCDAHLHLQDPRLEGDLEETIRLARAGGVVACVVNATSEADWPMVAELARTHPDWIIPSFGIHPWYSGTASRGWDARLAEILEEFPQAGIGECGLDRWVSEPAVRIQRPVFVRQLELAGEMDRTVSVHCLKAWGMLLEELSMWHPRRLMVHSFAGSVETASQLLRLGAHFSCSGYFLFPRKRPVLEMFRQLPKDRLLVESDSPDMTPPDQVVSYPLPDRRNHPANLPAIGMALSAIFGIPADELASNTSETFRRLFPFPSSSKR